jgi:hypothetical protein
VQVGEAVGEAGTEMQQGCGRLLGHARIAVGCAGRHALEQREHAAHALDAIERGDEMHFRGAGIGEADIHAAIDQRAHQTFGTVHLDPRLRWRMFLSANRYLPPIKSGLRRNMR